MLSFTDNLMRGNETQPPSGRTHSMRCSEAIQFATVSRPAASSSSTSCQRFGWREPGALVCASSSSNISCGLRASAASVTICMVRAACSPPITAVLALGQLNRKRGE